MMSVVVGCYCGLVVYTQPSHLQYPHPTTTLSSLHVSPQGPFVRNPLQPRMKEEDKSEVDMQALSGG